MVRNITFEWLPGEKEEAEKALEEVVTSLISEIKFDDIMRGENARYLVLRHELDIKTAMNKIPFGKKAVIAALKPASAAPTNGDDGFKAICEFALHVIREQLVCRLQRTLQLQY